jgi:glycosyltransferase involved in cell wall biosynthesis
MSEIILDVTRLLGRRLKGRLPTGIDRVCLAYVQEYRTQARALLKKGPFSRVLSLDASQDLFTALLDSNTPILAALRGTLLKSLSRPSPSPAPGSFVLNLGHSGLESRAYGQWLKAHGWRSICMVHDLIPVTHPEYCRPREKARHVERMYTVLKNSSGVLANSQSTLQALTAFAAAARLPLPRAAVAPLAGASLPRPAATRPLAQPYFVMLSTIEPRKNHWTILHTWRRLAEQLGADTPRLVLIGQRGWECENVIDLLERCEALKGVVLEKSHCSDEELATYLHHAQALLMPSFAEGFGLPLIEALSANVPVLASDLPVFREIAGSTPEYLDPLNAAEWGQRIQAYSREDSADRRAQIERISTFRAPSWGGHFEQFEALKGQLC